jgi:[acyl-carrier-protein] S-malonyltransferase
MSQHIALVFPGQGCQSVGMGLELAGQSPAARQVFEHANDVLGFDLAGLCFNGPAETLDDTANTQPAIYTASMALWQALAPRLEPHRERVAYLAGHSLGEFSALTAAGALDFEAGLRLVRRRGEAMRDAGAAAPGGMAAIIGLDDAAVAEIASEASGGEDRAWIANYNAPGQVVIAGSGPALERAMALAKARGARRALPLAVSVACHTPLMASAAAELGAALADTPFSTPWAPVVSNFAAVPLQDPEAIKGALLQQLSGPVRWVESVQAMAAAGVTHMVEIGPKAVVSGLVKRIAPDVALLAVGDLAGIEALGGEALGL